MSETKLRWGIKANMMDIREAWSLGMCISHWGPETYLYINLIFCTISIGKQYMEVRNEKA